MMTEMPNEPQRLPYAAFPVKGRAIAQLNVVLTGAFVLTSALAAVIFTQTWKSIAVVTSLVCFTVGVVAFLWGYWSAVQRSREDEIGVAVLYFLMDGVAPLPVSRLMNTLFGVQCAVALAAALSRPSTDGKPGSTLAFGILVPMLGLGLSGLWGALHGTFRPRIIDNPSRVPTDGDENGQDV
jgi:hypothetical protein